MKAAMAAWPASTCRALAPSCGSLMKDSAVRMVSLVPVGEVKLTEAVSAPSPACASTVLVVPKSSPSAVAMAGPHLAFG